MDVIDRVQIEPSTGCPFIELDGEEKDAYLGAGKYLAAFAAGRQAEVFDILDQIAETDDMQDDANAILKIAVGWVESQQNQGRQVMAGVFSCGSLCEPEPVPYPEGIARLGRFIGDAVVASRDY